MPTKKVKKTATKKVAKKSVVKKVAKKAVKKTAVKKVAKKPTKKVAKKTAKTTKKVVTKRAKPSRNLVFANEQTCFWVTNGQILNSLVALRDALDEMEKEVYAYHAGNAHNDFANWVAVVLNDNDCAKDLEKAKTSRSAKTTIIRHLKTYSI